MAHTVVQLKWGLKVGKRFYKKGTDVMLATLEEARLVFPGLKHSRTSAQVGVWLPGQTHPTIVHKKEITDRA